MVADSTLLSGVLITAFCAGISAPLFVSAADSPIQVESREGSSLTYRRPVEAEPESDGFEEQYQIQLLQQEVMQLRGALEQLEYELRRMINVQDDRYLELDARLQQALKVSDNLPTTLLPEKISEKDQAANGLLDGALSEKDQYETAQILIRNRQYEKAITQLEGFIERFPDGDLTANAYYWLGLVYTAKVNPDYERARQALAQVIDFFPNHSKVPVAAYALGKVYNTLGDCMRARELLQGVVQRYEGKSAANLAEKYLRESIDCDP